MSCKNQTKHPQQQVKSMGGAFISFKQPYSRLVEVHSFNSLRLNKISPQQRKYGLQCVEENQKFIEKHVNTDTTKTINDEFKYGFYNSMVSNLHDLLETKSSPDEVAKHLLLMRNYVINCGEENGNIDDRRVTGHWGVQLGFINRMTGALQYTPVLKKGEKFTYRPYANSEEQFPAEVKKVYSNEYGMNYDVDIEVPVNGETVINHLYASDRWDDLYLARKGAKALQPDGIIRKYPES